MTTEKAASPVPSGDEQRRRTEAWMAKLKMPHGTDDPTLLALGAERLTVATGTDLDKCGRCGGTGEVRDIITGWGQKPRSHLRPCPDCSTQDNTEIPCPVCGDTDDPGEVIWPTTGCLTRCDTCNGTGRVNTDSP